MSDDIVTRLKEQSGWNQRSSYMGKTSEMLWDAIDEIERRRAPLPAGDDLVEKLAIIAQNAMVDLRIDEDEIAGTGPASYAIARRILAAITPAIEARGRDAGDMVEEIQQYRETLMQIGEALGLDHVTAHNALDAIRAIETGARKKALEEATDLAQGVADMTATASLIASAESASEVYRAESVTAANLAAAIRALATPPQEPPHDR
jgi:hypothetical protein